MSTLLLLGATSAISQAYLEQVCKQFERIMLVARSQEKLDPIAQHIRVLSGAEIRVQLANLGNMSIHQKLFADGSEYLGKIDQVMICYGDLTDQARSRDDSSYTVDQFTLNATSTISLSSHAARALARQGGGDLVVVGSVAGDRGRKSNYVYGAAKGAVATYLAGLGMEMESDNVRVLTVKPGFVDSPMTAHLKKGALWAAPAKVASDIATAVDRQKSVLYTPWFWRVIMLIIKLLPRFLLKRLPV